MDKRIRIRSMTQQDITVLISDIAWQVNKRLGSLILLLPTGLFDLKW